MNPMETMNELNKSAPEFMKGFAGHMGTILKNGVISLKNKELIAVSLAVIKQCEACIELHTKKAMKAGANKDEIIEACQVAVLMGGGPALMYMGKVLELMKKLE